MDSNIQIQPLVLGTPLEDHLNEAGLLVKREDLSCPHPGPPFSKMRGVIEHMRKRVAEGVRVFGALDTFHSQAGHAVAYGARLLGVECINYFPVYKADTRLPNSGEGVPSGWIQFGNDTTTFVKLRDPQLQSNELGAQLVGLPAGRSAVLYHSAKRDCVARGGYMMPNALKLSETVEETAAEVVRTFERATREEFEVLRSSPWLISCSSATIASGVLRGLQTVLPRSCPKGDLPKRAILHMGYSRSRDAVLKYMHGHLGWANWCESDDLVFVDEGYEYKDVARAGPTPPWPCNSHYDLKALRWWLREGRERYGRAVMWNIG